MNLVERFDPMVRVRKLMKDAKTFSNYCPPLVLDSDGYHLFGTTTNLPLTVDRERELTKPIRGVKIATIFGYQVYEYDVSFAEWNR